MTSNISSSIQRAINKAAGIASEIKTQYVTPEMLLEGLLSQGRFRELASSFVKSLAKARKELMTHIKDSAEKIEGEISNLEMSFQLVEVLEQADKTVKASGAAEVDVPHIINAIYGLEESFAAYWLNKYVEQAPATFIATLSNAYNVDGGTHADDATAEQENGWLQYCHPLVNPDNDGWHLVGREKEMARAMLVLCRKGKCNPLFVGEHGVGKTAIVRGLAAHLEDGNVPNRLQGKRVYVLDFAAVISGTQFRGDFEKKMKEVLDGVAREKNVILFIDNIHEIVGAGRTSDNVADATSMLIPYMEGRQIAFIGATTFEEYKKSVNRNKNLERLFQKIDVDEPTRDESVEILQGLRPQYETFHGVTYSDEVIQYAVESSDRYIQGRFLPEKAIDLLDESGAYLGLHPRQDGSSTVDKSLLKEVLSRVSNIDLTDKGEDEDVVYSLKEELKKRIFGQESAIDTVCDAVYTAKAGLSDALKPLASFLFVGPTGVGKTQLAKDLAALLRVPLQRFDMSEYAEKHTVSKFIGAPAGYVGYEDGGILVDTIRRTPHCVLLLDEIEKAHQDIYNLLLQIMDYGTLSDSRGQKADFRNAIIILTSNAGARFANRASIGFSPTVNAGENMNKEVKNVFSPEFVNRLSATVVFNNLTVEMAGLIVDTKIAELDTRLKAKNVVLQYTNAAKAEILHRGYSQEYGAREVERVISRDIKPIVVKELLFGSLKKGGEASVDYNGEMFTITRKLAQ